MDYSRYYNVMQDGTVKQINPFTGNEVWAVPGRRSRPIVAGQSSAVSLDDIPDDAVCAFCSSRYLETPPEKFRWIKTDGRWSRIDRLLPDDYFDSIAEFRCVPNLFEIVSLEYWRKNYGYEMPASVRERLSEYWDDPAGRQHLHDVVRYKLSLTNEVAAEDLNENTIRRLSAPFFGGCHELINARHHFRNDSAEPARLVSSGRLTPEEHFYYMTITIESMKEIVQRNRFVRYVSVFQNWLRPAGASFDHLHKQLVGLDEWGASISRQIQMLQHNPNAFNEYASNFASMYSLMIAENDHALAMVGIGHRFPTVEVFSKSRHARPDEHSDEELGGISDLVHAIHAAMGPDISCNEEWYYSPFDTTVKTPWHVLIKWRVNTPAGFEGGTSIHINPLTPIELRDRMVSRLYELRDASTIAPIRIATECSLRPNVLLYNQQ